MTQPHGTTPSGQPVDLIGQPLRPGRGSVDGVVRVETSQMPKAPRGGVYELDGYRYKIKKGDPLPDGAVMWGGPDHPDVIEHGIQKDTDADEPITEVAEAPAKRSKGSAPENRAKADETEKR